MGTLENLKCCSLPVGFWVLKTLSQSFTKECLQLCWDYLLGLPALSNKHFRVEWDYLESTFWRRNPVHSRELVIPESLQILCDEQLSKWKLCTLVIVDKKN